MRADGDDLHLTVGERHYRVRGLAAHAPSGVFKLSLLARCGEGFHADSLDLCSARQRHSFAEVAAFELNVSSEILRRDLGRLLLALEAFQEERKATVGADKTDKIDKAAPSPALPPTLTDTEHDAALAFLQSVMNDDTAPLAWVRKRIMDGPPAR